MEFLARHVLELLMLTLAGLVHAYAAWRLRERFGAALAALLLGLALGALCFGLLLDAERIHRYFPSWFYSTFRGVYLAWLMIAIGVFGIHLLIRTVTGRAPQKHSPTRRRLLQASYAAPVAALGYGTFIERERFQIREVDIPMPKLPRELHGLRIVQITDVHLGDFLSERDFSRVIDMANDTRANLGIMTGDLITRRGDPVDACIRQLARIKADAGVIGCLGNHEIYADAQDYVAAQAARVGIDFLRKRSRAFTFNGRRIHFAGVDYQARRYGPYLVGAEKLIVPGETNVLLSHNPDVFRIAPEKGFDLTLAGHTHGGQIAIEYLNPTLNAARFATPWVAGYYHERGASLYVSRGIGTIGVPARIGVPPEVTLIRLCAT